MHISSPLSSEKEQFSDSVMIDVNFMDKWGEIFQLVLVIVSEDIILL